jgi:D-sedoheptulose 7-phosphate isomerase
MRAVQHEARARAEAWVRDAVSAVTTTLERGLSGVVDAAGAISRSLGQGGKVLVFGNGGSAAEAQHFAAELVGRFLRDRPAMPAIALTTDSSILTAIANDVAFEQVFARQVSALGRPGDVALGISTSGTSPNVVAGLDAARAAGLTTIGLTGRDGGVIGSRVDIHVNVPHALTGHVQEVQLMLLHVICDLVERDVADGRPPEAPPPTTMEPCDV